MTRNLRGAYMCFAHDRKADWDWLAAWQPNVVRLMIQGSHSDPNSVSVDLIERVHRAVPHALIVLRCWDVDDRRKPEAPHDNAHVAMVANPVAEAEKQVHWWQAVISRCNVPRQQLIAGMINEIDPSHFAPHFVYTKRALELSGELDVRIGAGVFSAGTPHLPGDGEYDINKYATLDPLVVETNSVWVFHEYMQPEGMYGVWTDDEGKRREDYSNLIGRHKRWPIKGKIIIGEWGIEGILYNRNRDPKWGNAGWLHFPELWPAERYANEYVACVRDASPNVIGICPFISDYADHRWQTADLMPAYDEFLARKQLCELEDVVQPSPRPVATHIPAVGTGSPSATPVPPLNTGIIDPTVAQAILRVESGGRTHGDNGKPIIRFEAHIFKTYLGNDALWAQHFRTDANRPWVDQMWRQSPADPWRVIHTGKQSDEYSVFEFAASLHAEAAHKAISVGAAQIMGFNHARIGYASAQAMYSGFQSAPMQTLGFFNFCLSDRELMAAIARRDWREIAKRYNGPGNVDTYAKLLQQAYEASQ